MKLPLLLLTVTLASCSYKIQKHNCPELNKSFKEKPMHFSKCSYAPLWLNPMFPADYADLNKHLPKDAKVVSIEQKVYPFVLFTKTCIEADYTM
ncbi:hypothetical protein [Candidatus Deianiraea vastatrix]|uniref:Lipoprotein n=1 Tax=Candidatus Deianiraea vastatrix TaxID=2163644 RepID=A0A5B8XF95_9RICK|nr:hypothetical protein [Candidatus Deianiraea vastatrix]QED23104.1 hypothetical protein Deia_00297 [Candidatus Deianiraea vastatrix]